MERLFYRLALFAVVTQLATGYPYKKGESNGNREYYRPHSHHHGHYHGHSHGSNTGVTEAGGILKETKVPESFPDQGQVYDQENLPEIVSDGLNIPKGVLVEPGEVRTDYPLQQDENIQVQVGGNVNKPYQEEQQETNEFEPGKGQSKVILSGDEEKTLEDQQKTYPEEKIEVLIPNSPAYIHNHGKEEQLVPVYGKDEFKTPIEEQRPTGPVFDGQKQLQPSYTKEESQKPISETKQSANPNFENSGPLIPTYVQEEKFNSTFDEEKPTQEKTETQNPEYEEQRTLEPAYGQPGPTKPSYGIDEPVDQVPFDPKHVVVKQKEDPTFQNPILDLPKDFSVIIQKEVFDELPVHQENISSKPSQPTEVDAPVPEVKYPALRDLCQSLDLKRFITLVNRAGMADIFSGSRPVTIFAPSDEAFTKLPVHVYHRLTRDVDFLRQVLSYHVVDGECLGDRLNDKQEPFYQTRSPSMGIYLKNVKGKMFVNGKSIVKTDQRASNGIVQVIDSVLHPLPSKTISEATQSAGSFTRFNLMAIDSGIFQDELAGKGPFTVFAPTDSAFTRLPRRTLEWLSFDKEACKALLRKHIVPGAYFSSLVPEEETNEFVNLDGDKLDMKHLRDHFLLNGVRMGPGAQRDIITQNGVLQGVTEVLFSKNLTPREDYKRPSLKRIYSFTH